MPTTPTSPGVLLEEWLSIQEASVQLGVAPSTLRRWGEQGLVAMKRTVGGHRRFARSEVDRLMAEMSPTGKALSTPPSSAPLAPAHKTPHPHWGVDEHDLERQRWHLTRMGTQPLAQRMRGLGQRLLGLLIQYINKGEDDSRFLDEARQVGTTYGTEARIAQVRLQDLIEAYLYFRGAFSHVAMPLPGITQPTDLAESAVLHTRINRFMDAVLLGLVVGYEQGQLLAQTS